MKLHLLSRGLREKMERVILHSDLNCFYASVEMMLNPSLCGKAVAVCGSTESRHGIVLAKSELAKKRGVKTGWSIGRLASAARTLSWCRRSTTSI
jgi:nucleotidyltransferase/DNA polymerase involved in DNA repair